MNRSHSCKYLLFAYVLTIAVFFIALPTTLDAQGYLKAEVRNTNCPVASHEADRWFFGQNAGLDFRTGDPVADLNNHLLNVPTSPAIISDSTGNILFFTDGTKVYNRLGQVMPNGDGLHGFAGYTMPVIIVPKPGSDDIFYIFTVHRPKQNQFDNQQLYGFEYNEVNMTLAGGLGDVTRKNRQLLPPEMSSRLSAVRSSNGKDYWVVTHTFNSSTFYSVRVTENGVDTNNLVPSNTNGTIHAAPGETNNGIGYMKISPDGTRLAMAIHGSSVFELYDFNASSGTVSQNPIVSQAIFDDAYGVEFSSDSRYLYGTTTSTSLPQPNQTPPSYLFQFDINNGASIFTNYDTIAVDTLGSYFGGMQLASDGRIYVSRSPYGNAAVSVIENPKRPGLNCNFAPNAVDLAGAKSRFGFPNFVQSFFDLPHFDVENICFEDNTLFNLQNNSNVESVTWTFGDPASGAANTSAQIQGSHMFTGPGTYTVSVTEIYGGIPFGPYTEEVVVNELPQVEIGDTVYMYPGSPILLDAGEGFTSYEWSNGANTQVVRVTEPGEYWVTVQNEKCCFNIDTTLVLYFDVMVPNAFRPGGVNNIFRGYASNNDAINNYRMYIYNRWGQQLFLSEDIEQGWDGKVNGADAPGDVYVWIINYDVEREGKTDRISYKGNVVLLR